MLRLNLSKRENGSATALSTAKCDAQVSLGTCNSRDAVEVGQHLLLLGIDATTLMVSFSAFLSSTEILPSFEVT